MRERGRKEREEERRKGKKVSEIEMEVVIYTASKYYFLRFL